MLSGPLREFCEDGRLVVVLFFFSGYLGLFRFFFCVQVLFIVSGSGLRVRQNLLAWGERNKFVPELMMQMNLVDEAMTGCNLDWNGMRRVKRIETTDGCLLDLDWTQIILKIKSEII